MENCDRISIEIKMAGDIATAKSIIRKFCWERGWCVTITPTTFIYSGGEEEGFVVGVENYPRFPSNLEDLLEKAKWLAEWLSEGLCQKSYLICTPTQAKWYTRKMPFEKEAADGT